MDNRGLSLVVVFIQFYKMSRGDNCWRSCTQKLRLVMGMTSTPVSTKSVLDVCDVKTFAYIHIVCSIFFKCHNFVANYG